METNKINGTLAKAIVLSGWNEWLTELTEQLVNIQNEETNVIKGANRSIQACKKILSRLEDFVTAYKFKDQQEEIFFFKEIKPKICGQLIYFHKVYMIEISRPIGDQTTYLQKEADRLQEFYINHKFFYQYFRSGQTYLDDKLFLRQPHGFSLHTYETGYESLMGIKSDHLLSTIYANDMLQDYLGKALVSLNGHPVTEANKHTPESPLNWTESKTALIELIYALQAANVFNNGKADLKQIIDFFQSSFNIDLGNTSRTFQEILCRKTGYTNFIDKIRDKLLHRIEKVEEKYNK